MIDVRYERRMDFLDGLRGMSILFVIFFHIQKTALLHSLPNFIKPLFLVFFENGYLGVMFFFILSGFLTRYHHKNIGAIHFYIKRFYRLFPAFIGAVICMQIFKFFPDTNILLRVVLIAGCAFIVNRITRALDCGLNKKVFFWTLIILQLIAVFIYGFIIGRQPLDWFSEQTAPIQFISQLIVNGTLTVYLRNHIPVLDGVYWTMLIELIFIFLYPILLAPFFNWLSKQKIQLHFIVFLLIVFGLLFTRFIFRSIRILNNVSIENLGYFFSGIYISDMRERIDSSAYMKKIISVFSHPLMLILIFSINQYIYIPNNMNNIYLSIFLKLLMIFPLSLIFISFFYPKTFLNSLLRTPLLKFIGIISYSLYLTHNGIIDGISLWMKPTNIFNTFGYSLIVLMAAIPMAWIYTIIINYEHGQR